MDNNYQDYNSFITSSLWYEKRDWMLKLNPNCKICNKKANQVHHLHYNLWLGNESRKDIISVCKKCHQKIHQNSLKGDKAEFNFNNTKNRSAD